MENPDGRLKKIILLGTPIWLLGFLWSAESAIYSSVTFLPAIFIAILQGYPNKLNDFEKKGHLFKHLLRYLSVPVLSFIGVISIITAYYWLRLSNAPDFYCFVEHGLSYAGGFGQFGLNPTGPVWLLVLLFGSILFMIVKVILRNPLSRELVPLVGAIGCLWSISSYFIGRAVANNVTAILPILGFISIVVLKSSEGNESNSSHLIYKAVTLPLFTIILMTSFGNIDFVNKIKQFQTLESDFSSKVMVAGSDLQDLLNKAKVRNTDPIVFYGYPSEMPRWKFGDQLILRASLKTPS